CCSSTVYMALTYSMTVTQFKSSFSYSKIAQQLQIASKRFKALQNFSFESHIRYQKVLAGQNAPVKICLTCISNMMQDKNVTLRKSVVIINTLKVLEQPNLLLRFGNSKRKRREPNNLNDFIVTTTTSTIYELGPVESTESILDSIIDNLKKIFSPESLSLAISVDKYMQLNYEGSLVFIDYYMNLNNINNKNLLCIIINSKVNVFKLFNLLGLLNINKLNIKSEMTVARNCINKINNDLNINDLKTTIKKKSSLISTKCYK
ncbi:zinc finger MYM-type protein 1-like, partial [Aphis craccivora]